MKKILIVCLLLLVSVIFATGAYAADNVRSANFAGVDAVVVSDASSGACAEIDSDGSVQVQNFGSDLIAVSYEGLTSGSATPGELLYTGACRVHSITVTGVSAGDYVEVYDALSRTGVPKFDPKVGTANDTTTIALPGGVAFSTGIYVYPIDVEVQTAITYNI